MEKRNNQVCIRLTEDETVLVEQIKASVFDTGVRLNTSEVFRYCLRYVAKRMVEVSE